MSMHELVSYIHGFEIYQWQDLVEIIFLSFAFHGVITWLSKDKYQLLEWFYLYWTIFFVSYFARLEVISRLLFVTAPIVGMIFILIHHRTLQQHFITIKRKYQPASHDWIGALMQTTLIAMNKGKNFLCVIECTESLEDFLQAPVPIDGIIHEYFLTTLIESPQFNESQIVWCNQKGKLISFNAQWKKTDYQEWLNAEIQQEYRWKQEALFFTQKTHFIIFKLNPFTRSYDVIINAHVAEKINAPQLAQLLYRACNIPAAQQQHIIDQKDFYGNSFKKPYQEQQR